MHRRSLSVSFLFLTSTFLIAAQEPPAGTNGPQPGGRGGRGATPPPAPTYPRRPTADPEVLARGKALWEARCASCHAMDLRGSNRGINLVRSKLVLDDRDGELIGAFLDAPHAAGGAAKSNWTPEELRDAATYMHNFEDYGKVMAPVPPAAILVGDARAGATYFRAKCAACHSVDGSPSKATSLQGIGSRIGSAKAMQNALVSGNGGGASRDLRTVTATLTWPTGRKAEGTLVSHDDFLVILKDQDGRERSYRRDGAIPKLEIHDPLKPHRDLLPVYTDKDIHDLTAYLVTLK